MFRQTVKTSLKYSFWNCVDNLFTLFVVNLIWFAIHFIPIYLYSLQPIVGEFKTDLPDLFDLFGLLHFVSKVESNDSLNLLVLSLGAERVDLIREGHKMLLFAVFFLFSPFSLSVWALNASIGKKQLPRIRDFFIESYKQGFRSILFLLIGLLLVISSYINIRFYQNLFSHTKFVSYIFGLGILTLELLFFSGFLQIIPMLMNKEKKTILALKRAYWLLIRLLPSTIMLLFSYLAILLLVKWHLVPGLDFILMLFFYPAFWGQFMNEHYLTSTEIFGFKRQTEERRSFKDFLFPWKNL